MNDSASDEDSTAPSMDASMQALTDHVSNAFQQHATRASNAAKRTSGAGYDPVAIQRDLFDASMQIVTDSLNAVSHLTNIARAASDKR